MTTIQGDASIGFKKNGSSYGSAVTVDRWLEFLDESWDFDREYYQGAGLRPGSRAARSGRRVLVRDGAMGDVSLEVPTKGLGTLLELLLGTAVSSNVSGSIYQQLHTPVATDYLPHASFQVGIPRLGADTVDAYTMHGVSNESFSLACAGAGDVLKLSSSWKARELVTDVSYATPSYASGIELFSFVGASLKIGGSVTVPTTTALATGGTAVADVRDFSINVTQGNDSNGYNIGSSGKRSRPPAVGLAEITGSLTAEYDSTTFRDAVRDQTDLALVATFLGPTAISGGTYPTLQIVCPNIRFSGELPKSAGGDVITQNLAFTAFDNLVAAKPIYIAMVTADTAL